MKRVRRDEFRVTPPDDTCVMIHWVKIGGGSLHIANHIIKPNEKFWAARESIPKAFLNTLVPLSELPKDESEEENKSGRDLGYRLESKGGGWYDVVDKFGKVVSEKSMRYVEAIEVLKNL